MSDVKVKVFTGSGSINFEEDQREDLHSVNNAKSLSDQVVKLKQLEDQLEEKEKALLTLIDTKDDIQEEGEAMSNILAAKTILSRAQQNSTTPQLELRLFFKSVRDIIK